MTDIAKRPPSFTVGQVDRMERLMAEMPNIRELYERADWPDGEFRLSCDEILEPGGMFMGKFWESELEKARARFICEAVNYWLRHLRGAVEREKHMDTYRGAKKL